MARTAFKVEVLTPEGEVFNDDVEMISTRTTVGSIGVLAHHQPLLGILEPTELRLYRSDLQERLRKAEQAAEEAEAGSEQQRRALRDKKRWEAFLRIAGG